MGAAWQPACAFGWDCKSEARGAGGHPVWRTFFREEMPRGNSRAGSASRRTRVVRKRKGLGAS
eukprot:3538540-Prymnesium_polylepis.1